MGAYLCSLRNRVTEDFDLDVTKGRVEGDGHDCGRAASWSKVIWRVGQTAGFLIADLKPYGPWRGLKTRK